MPQGKVKWFSDEKGYGFIAPTEGGRDVFVHRKNVNNLAFGESLQEGELVEFETEQTPKGLNAQDVERLDAF